MSELLKTENAGTTISTKDSTQKEKVALPAETVRTADTLIRTPIKSETEQSSGVKEAGGVVNETTGDSPELPPSLYREANKIPYILELFEATDIYKQFSLETEINDLDTFILSEVKRMGIPDTKESYKKVLDGLYEHVREHDGVYNIIGQLTEWVKIQTKLREAVKEKEEFEKKPIEEMTSSEIRKVLYANNKR